MVGADRKAGAALGFAAAVLLATTLAAWLTTSPLAQYETLVLGPDGQRALSVPLDAPIARDETVLAGALALEALRRYPALVGTTAFLAAVVLWFRGQRSRKVRFRDRMFFVVGTLWAAGAVGTFVFSPPSLVSMILSAAAQSLFYLVLGALGLLLASVRTRRGLRES